MAVNMISCYIKKGIEIQESKMATLWQGLFATCLQKKRIESKIIDLLQGIISSTLFPKDYLLQ